MLIINAFSANMLDFTNGPVSARFSPLTTDEAVCLAVNGQSAVGHADTAAVFTGILGVPVPMARVNVSLQKGDRALLGQYKGPRLPEGATSLPEGARIEWLWVEVY